MKYDGVIGSFSYRVQHDVLGNQVMITAEHDTSGIGGLQYTADIAYILGERPAITSFGENIIPSKEPVADFRPDIHGIALEIEPQNLNLAAVIRAAYQIFEWEQA